MSNVFNQDSIQTGSEVDLGGVEQCLTSHTEGCCATVITSPEISTTMPMAIAVTTSTILTTDTATLTTDTTILTTILTIDTTTPTTDITPPTTTTTPTITTPASESDLDEPQSEDVPGLGTRPILPPGFVPRGTNANNSSTFKCVKCTSKCKCYTPGTSRCDCGKTCKCKEEEEQRARDAAKGTSKSP